MNKICWGLVLICCLFTPLAALAAEEAAPAPPAADALEIIAAAPQGDLNSLADGRTITITFNRPVVALSGVEQAQREGPLTLEPAVSGVYRWMGTSTLSFTADEPLTYATRYVVRVEAPITALDGAAMTEDYSFSFVTPRPQVERVFPYQDDTHVTLQEPYFLRFNQPMSADKAAPFISLQSASGEETPVAVMYPDEADVERQQPYWVNEVTDTIFKVVPQQPLAIETEYTLRLKAGLPGKAGNLGMAQTYELRFQTYAYFRATGIAPARSSYCGDQYYPEYGIELSFSNAVRRDDLLQHIHFRPAVEFEEDEYSYDTREFYLAPNFQPNTRYTLTIDAGLQDIYGNILSTDATYTFETVDYAAYLSMPTGRLISEAYLGARFPVKVMNVYNAPLQLTAYRTPEATLQAVKAMEQRDFEISDPDVSREYRPDILHNTVATMPFDLSEVLHEGETNGILGMTLAYDDCASERRTSKSLISLTNLSASAKFSADNNLFWVTRLEDASPVEGATIELYDENQRFLTQVETDADGFAETPGWKGLGLKATSSWQQPWVFAIVRLGDDRVVIHSRDGTGIWPYRFDIRYQPDSEHLTNDGYLFTERGIYRPGEEVKIVGIVRDKQEGAFVIPENLEVEVRVTDPKAKEIYHNTFTLSEFGSFHFPLQLGENAKIGTYQITCDFPFPAHTDFDKDERRWIGNSISGTFKVEMYRPVEFEVKVNLEQETYIKGDALRGVISANYLFGGAVRDVPLEWNLNRSAYMFYPEDDHFSGYRFNVSDRDEWAHVADQTARLDEQGEYAYEYTITDTVPGAYHYTLEATVTDLNQRRVSNRQSFVMHGGEYYIGLQPESFFASTDEDFMIRAIALSPAEEFVAGQAYQVTVKRIWWESVRRAGNGGRLYWESEQKEEVVQEFAVQSKAEPVELTIPIDKVGYYKVEAKGADSRGNEIASEDYFYAIGSGYAAWMRQDDDAVELVKEKSEYQPGDVARILVKSPYERVKALVTIEREGVMDRWVETLEGSADTIEIPVKSEYIPNVYVGVILVQGRTAYDQVEGEIDPGKPGFKIGYTGFDVNPAERRLNVAVTTDQEEYRPGTEVEVEVQVQDQDGQGRAAEVVLSVVDIGVLNLIGYETPDPFDYFYRMRPLAVLTSELRNSIVGQRNYSEKGERQAGGGIDAAAMLKMIRLREKFKPTAYHNPAVRTDDAGRATVRFTLPDNLTAFRIMATAHTKDSFFGAGDKRITVNKDLMLTSALPRFMRIGDTLEAGVLAHNRTDQTNDALIQAEADGVLLTSDDVRETPLPEGDKQEVRFTYKAEEEQDATLTFRGRLGDATDGLQVTLPVLLHRRPLTTALFGSTEEASHREWVRVPEDAQPGWGSVQFSLASTLFTDIKGSADYLFGYPYGCLEQRISRILPIILAEDLIAAFEMDVFETDDYRTVVQETLDQLAAFQTDNGGFDYWKPPEWPSPFVSAYAVFTMLMAKDAGYAVDREVEEQAVQYLQKVLKGQNERATLYRYNDLAWNATDAFILYVLALHDKYEPAYATRLYEVRGRLPVFGKALLLKAVEAGRGDELIRQTLHEELLNAARIEARTAYFEESDDTGLAWIHHSNVRSTAAVTQAFMEVYGASEANESFISKAIQWLLRQRKDQLSWRTTQENLFVFWTLATYLRTFEGAVPDFTGKVLVNGREILAELFQGRTTKVAEQWAPLDRFTRGEDTPVDFVKEGQGRMYYTAALTYLPLGTPEPLEAGIAVQKQMTVVKGMKGQEPGTFQRGDLIRLDLTITTPRDRLFVFVDDPLPAGFNAINLSLKTTDQSLREFLENDSPFRHSEFMDDRVVFYANYVGKGVHTVSYLVSAEHSGQFNLPPTYAAEMYTPEVFGQTGVDLIEIR